MDKENLESIHNATISSYEWNEVSSPTINMDKTGDYHGKANKSVTEGQHEATHVECKTVGLLASENKRYWIYGWGCLWLDREIWALKLSYRQMLHIYSSVILYSRITIIYTFLKVIKWFWMLLLQRNDNVSGYLNILNFIKYTNIRT